MSFQKTVNDIKSLKIQGAENVAKEAVKSLLYVLEQNKKQDPDKIIRALERAKLELFATRPTEPCMRNALNNVLHNLQGATSLQIGDCVRDRVNNTLSFFDTSEDKISDYASSKIKDGMTVYTHCHSSTVTRAIRKAWKQGKHTEVRNTETRPRYQGRKTAEELASEGITVIHYVDAAARHAIMNSDIMMIGADAITADGTVINKIGSGTFAEIAKKYNVPVYVCANSWKFDPDTTKGHKEIIEIRGPKEVWEKTPKNVKIENIAFESISPELITGIISEKGIHKPKEFAKIMKKNKF